LRTAESLNLLKRRPTRPTVGVLIKWVSWAQRMLGFVRHCVAMLGNFAGHPPERPL